MKINAIGSMLGSTGYDSHFRQLINAIYKINPDIKIDIPLSPNYMQLINDAELSMLKKPYRISDITIGILTPPFWRIALADNCKKFVGFCVWEGDKIPEYWIEYLMDERIDQIWVPSQHTKDAIINTLPQSGSIETQLPIWINKIKIVPHGVDMNKFYKKDVKKNKKFTFISNKGWKGGYEDRGGVAYVLKAFCEEFGKDEPVQLLLKLNQAYLNPNDLSKKLDELKLPEDRPEIKVNIGNLKYEDLINLYCQSDVYVCAQRADGFGLGSAEAMACGLPVLVSGYGGQVEHIEETKHGKFFKYIMQEVKGDIMYEGISWCVPDLEDIKKKMRLAYNNQNKLKEIGDNGHKFIEENFTWDISAQKAITFLKELE